MAKKITAPSHIALIPDGNRRWSRTHKLQILSGHSTGIDRFIEFAKWSKEFGIKTVSVWALSTENLTGRPPMELRGLFELYVRAARDKKVFEMLKENGAKLRIIGDMSKLPKRLKDALKDIEFKTRTYKEITINLLINYGGKEDLIYSAQQISRAIRQNKNAKIDEEFIKEHLRSSSIPDVDLIVRTSGEMRLSGLLPWQGSYSELYFAKKYWPDFTKEDFRKAIETFSRRRRRFGK
ncbi:MAG: polyprenyl diphosphate synthase [Candidatus Micrarchaeales archaeon]